MGYALAMPYTLATPASLKLRYPEFVSVADVRVQYWLDDASARYALIGEWTDPDGPVAQMMVAAHSMILEGLGGASDSAAIPDGVTALRTGNFSLSLDASVARDRAAGGWNSTKYGAQYLALLRLHRGGARHTSLGTFQCQDGGRYGY